MAPHVHVRLPRSLAVAVAALALAAPSATARPMIHAHPGLSEQEAQTLASCHLTAIAAAAELGCRTVAIPAISTGIFGYPPERAAEVAVAATRQALAGQDSVERVSFVLFDEQTLRIYASALQA